MIIMNYFIIPSSPKKGTPFSFLVWTAPDYASFARRLNLSLKSGPDFSFKILTSASRISCFQLSFDKLKSYHPHQPESHHSSLSNTSDWVNKAWQWLDLESIKVGKIKTVRLVRVTLIAGFFPGWLQFELFPLKFSISSQSGWQAGAINVTLGIVTNIFNQWLASRDIWVTWTSIFLCGKQNEYSCQCREKPRLLKVSKTQKEYGCQCREWGRL